MRRLYQLAVSKTARNTYLVFLGNSISAFFAFILTVILVRGMSKSDFGYYSAVFSFALLLSDVSDIGIGSSLSRFLPPLKADSNKTNRFLKTALIYQSGIVLILAIFVVVFSKFLAVNFFHDPSLGGTVAAVAIALVGMTFSSFFSYAFSAKEKFYGSAIIPAVSSISRVILIVPFVLLATLTIGGALWIQIISFILTSIIGLVLINPGFLLAAFDLKNLKSLIRFSSFLGIARSFTAISSRLDTLMLIAMTNSIETAVYATASRIISIYPLLSGSFSAVLAPRFATIRSENELNTFLKKVILGTAGIILTIIILIIVAYPFMMILFGEKTRDSVPVLQLLLVAMIFFVASVPPVSLAIYYLKKPHILSINSVIQLIIVIAGNLYFIPKFGRFGPIYSLMLAYGITLVFTTYLSIYYLKKHHEHS
ncbi:MAG: oligosaccharide flippase family protein [Bacteroidota bacterium]